MGSTETMGSTDRRNIWSAFAGFLAGCAFSSGTEGEADRERSGFGVGLFGLRPGGGSREALFAGLVVEGGNEKWAFGDADYTLGIAAGSYVAGEEIEFGQEEGTWPGIRFGLQPSFQGCELPAGSTFEA